MRANHDELARAAQEQVSWQLATVAMVGDAVVQALRQYTELNMGMLRLTLEQANLTARQLASAQDARQFISRAAAQIQPGAMRGFDYGYYLTRIIAEMQGDALQAFVATPEKENAWDANRLRFDGPEAWPAGLSFLNAFAESLFRFPADLARAARLALNINAPAWESGKLRVAYAAPRHGER